MTSLSDKRIPMLNSSSLIGYAEDKVRETVLRLKRTIAEMEDIPLNVAMLFKTIDEEFGEKLI